MRDINLPDDWDYKRRETEGVPWVKLGIMFFLIIVAIPEIVRWFQ